MNEIEIVCAFSGLRINRNKIEGLWIEKQKHSKDKVKRSTLIGDFEKSGLKMIDIESYFIFLKASWVSRLADQCGKRPLANSPKASRNFGW